jgi:hypothetical protein
MIEDFVRLRGHQQFKLPKKMISYGSSDNKSLLEGLNDTMISELSISSYFST